jgi:hypothetical protein
MNEVPPNPSKKSMSIFISKKCMTKKQQQEIKPELEELGLSLDIRMKETTDIFISDMVTCKDYQYAKEIIKHTMTRKWLDISLSLSKL